jgi:serine/threonine protein phosphatase 1
MRWIIGDIHGMLRPLEAVLTEVLRRDADAVFYFTGDYTNRGPDSRGVIELLLSLRNIRCIRGNHDDILDQIIHGAAYSENAARGDRVAAFGWFLEHGLLETLLSYGATREQISAVLSRRDPQPLDLIIDLIPPAHRQFIRDLPALIEDDDLFVLHGKWPLNQSQPPTVLLEGTMPDPSLRKEILWGRFTEAELRKAKSWPKTGFFGHTPVVTYPRHQNNYCPIIAARMILIDTAAALSPQGRLSAMCAETSELVQADPQGKLVAPPVNWGKIKK